MKKLLAITLTAILLTGCATWSHGELKKDGKPVQATVDEKDRVAPEKIQIVEGDILDRKYEVLGELAVVVNKTTIFNADLTKEMVNKKLQESASIAGADAVIQVRYGTVGVSLTSWGSLEGKGRAVKFTN